MLLLAYLLFLSILYQFQILFLLRGLLKPIQSPRLIQSTELKLGLLIVHKNDTSLLAETLASLQIQNREAYDWPIYILDDYSHPKQLERLRELAKDFNARVISNESERGKKSALQWFLPQLKEDYIIQVDADCRLGPSFLKLMAAAISQKPALVVAQVRMKPNANIWSRLAALDHLSLQLVSFSALAQQKVIMAAGAAMAYQPRLFKDYMKVGEKWSGGEDTFVAQAMHNDGLEVLAQPYAYVETDAPANFKHFIKQRLRWGAKSVDYPKAIAKFLAFTVALINLSLVIGVLASPWFSPPPFFWIFWLYKMFGDALLLHRYSRFYGGAHLLKSYLFLALLYPFYIGLVVCLIPFAKKAKWQLSR